MGIGTNTDDVRRRNLSAVLTLVHRARALSRSELTRRTGLSRSTVKDLVEELAAAGLVEESQAAPASQVGRPSPMVRPQTGTLAIAVNPETDSVTVGLVALGGAVLEVTRYPTRGVPSVRDTVAITAKAVSTIERSLHRSQRVTAIGVAVPGLVHAPTSVVRLAPNLDWHDEALGTMLSSATGLPVFAANDANLGAIAEHIFGGHPSAQHMIYVNGGKSGIGAGFVVAGELLEGAAGYAGELGHTYVGGAGPCHCGRIGCLETEVSESSTKSTAHQAQYLGIALGNAINLLNPNLIVLGGFLGAFPAQADAALATAITRHSMRVPNEQVRIVPGTLGSDTLMIGAAEAAFAALLADPAGYCRPAVGDAIG
ncbi:ROK family transcriptional regulator [Mycolicibacterium sp. 120266]|jgi:predicted NBD/HSP70 family sugar kinase|uniref:ROK family transcriptional regulator n=1 Tax=Mycolicibacterium sp. 120266 TaxID=3090601 RepID=UPI00299E3689|nr:ROK family transcriptional regulator [Mycolicibacterium sp. 120266]MDX1873220.1 ROK family transcriptional regulator [Mycolicibacterium sp. 120266]